MKYAIDTNTKRFTGTKYRELTERIILWMSDNNQIAIKYNEDIIEEKRGYGEDIYKKIDENLFEKEKLKFDKKISNINRGKLLKSGALSQDKKMWFNQETSIMFAAKVNSLKNDNDTILWKNSNRQIVTLTKLEAEKYLKEIIEILDKVYGLK